MYPQTLPWYRSQVIVAAIISIVSKLLVGFGVIGEFTPEAETELAATIVLVIGGLADLWAMRARLVQKAAPTITATKKP